MGHPRLWLGMGLLLLVAGCLGVFAARDLILFYVFFEFTLIPLFFLIGVWGSEQREYAAEERSWPTRGSIDSKPPLRKKSVPQNNPVAWMEWLDWSV